MIEGKVPLAEVRRQSREIVQHEPDGDVCQGPVFGDAETDAQARSNIAHAGLRVRHHHPRNGEVLLVEGHGGAAEIIAGFEDAPRRRSGE